MLWTKVVPLVASRRRRLEFGCEGREGGDGPRALRDRVLSLPSMVPARRIHRLEAIVEVPGWVISIPNII